MNFDIGAILKVIQAVEAGAPSVIALIEQLAGIFNSSSDPAVKAAAATLMEHREAIADAVDADPSDK